MVVIAVSKNKVNYPQFITLSSQYRTKINYSEYLIISCDKAINKILCEFVTSEAFTDVIQSEKLYKNILKISKTYSQEMHRVFLPKKMTEYMGWQKHLRLDIRETDRGFELSP